MNQTRPPGLFVTGTDTEVGKTRVAAAIARQLHQAGTRVGVYKPAASGCSTRDAEVIANDAVELWEAAGQPGRLEDVCPQRFIAPLAPHLAARAEAKTIDEDLLIDGIEKWNTESELIVVEGVGGLMSPLGEGYVADVVAELKYPIVVVVPNVLGAINQALQTLITASMVGDGVPIAGVVLNNVKESGDEASRSNRSELEERCVPPILAELPWNADAFDETVDWLKIARQHSR